MGTRSIIAKPQGDGWEGAYHHWDGYPSALGVTLLELHATHFGGDVDAMIRYLIDDEPVGWSTINRADWSLPKSWDDDHDPASPCGECGQEIWRHYAQYYPEGDAGDPMVNGGRRKGLILPDQVMQLGHSFVRVKAPKGPQSYSARGEGDGTDRHHYSTDDDFAGAEWVYVLCPSGIMVFEGDLGMFGCGGGNFRDPRLVPWGDMTAMLALESTDDE
jgi:hypothetical protein